MSGQSLPHAARFFWSGAAARGAIPMACGAVLSFDAFFGGLQPAHAQAEPVQATEAEPASSAAPEVVAPTLLYFASLTYPSEARAAGEEADVVLQVTIDSQGRVTSAEVVGSASAEFDRAALAAVRGFIFSPATRGGVPVAARILYSYPFRLPQPVANDEPRVVESAPPSTSATSSAPSTEPETEVLVKGLSVGGRMQQSAEAVHVVETTRARRETADMGQVVARTQGVVVRRSGGLGSDARFTLNGLSGDQVRYFLDGVPLDQAGYPLGIANVPVNLIERVEIYRGVVPIRFGADALGGAVNLVTRQGLRGTHGFASYEFGSFHTYRMAVGAQTFHAPTGVFVRGDGFHDYARNDYPVDVEVTNLEDGRLTPRTLRRFHDTYRATGGGIEAGFVGRPWARRLLLRLFATDYDRDVQHNRSMTRVFGEVTDGQSRAGATLRYENSWEGGLALEALATYSQGAFEFRDTSRCTYNWYGECQTVRLSVGELDGRPYDRRVDERALLGRVNLSHESDAGRTIKLSVTPSLVKRDGEERALSKGARRDPSSGENTLGTVVSGLEYELDLLQDRLENVVFAKDYFQSQQAVEPLVTGHDAERNNELHRLGWGDGLRYRFTGEWYGKVSYELATRLPKPNEVFGDASLVIPNFDLKPETSHNGNVTVAAPSIPTDFGEFRVEVGGYVRDVHNQILLLQGVTTAQYENIADARFLGVDTAVGWTSLRDYLALDANVTVQDARNTSTEGPFRAYEGDRLPNQPYLFGNGAARFQLRELATARDELSLVWNTRYVHQFYLSWERFGSASTKSVVESQLLHSLGLTYLIRHGEMALSSTLEVQNLTDAESKDYFGVQKPGRAFFFKSVAEM